MTQRGRRLEPLPLGERAVAPEKVLSSLARNKRQAGSQGFQQEAGRHVPIIYEGSFRPTVGGKSLRLSCSRDR